MTPHGRPDGQRTRCAFIAQLAAADARLSEQSAIVQSRIDYLMRVRGDYHARHTV